MIQKPSSANPVDVRRQIAPLRLPGGDEVELLFAAVLGQLSLRIDELCFSAHEELDAAEGSS